MEERRLSTALERCERALSRIEQVVRQRQQARGRDEELRAKVRHAVAELDQLIRMAEA